MVQVSFLSHKDVTEEFSPENRPKGHMYFEQVLSIQHNPANFATQGSCEARYQCLYQYYKVDRKPKKDPL